MSDKRLMLTSTVEGVWQSEHLASDTDQAVALTLSGSAEQSRRGSHQQTHINTKFIQNTSAHVRRRPTLPEPFVIAEDCADEQHPSQATTTDDSILNLRDANSQSSKNSHSRQSQDNSHKSVVPAVRYTTPIGSSGLEHQTLPHSLDSREPPQPPPSSDDKMSDLSPPAGSLSEGSQPLETRAKLRKIREESAAKLEASRRSREVSNQSSARASPSGTPDERRPSVAPAVLIAHPILGGEGQHVSVPSANQKPQSSPAFDRHNLSHMRPIVGRRTKYPNVVFARSKPVAAPPSRRALSTPPVIPSKAPYKVQEEPSRLEVEPLVLSKEMPLPGRNTQSVPHTPTTPSKLAMHTEALPSQTMTLEPISLGPAEYVIPLSMQPRIVSQYTDTMNYYRGAVTKNMTEETISKEVVEKLNTLLCRLGNVSTHIGLEGGGPSSQEMVEAKQEALYAEMSSEKFNLLAHLFAFIQDQQLHITLVAKDGHLINIIETFLKGKGIPYKRPGHLMEEPNLKDGKLVVSLIISGDVCLTTTPRKADLVIALDETFDAADEQILAVRKPSAIRDDLTPVLRLVVYSSVEHLVLCLPPTLEPIDRIRNLIFCVYATRNLIGQIKSDDLPTQIYARNIAALIPHPNVFSQLPRIRPIEDIPTMDSDSTLSNSMSDTEMEQLNVQASRYFPYHNISRKRGDMGPSSPPPGGKRPFVSVYLPRKHITI